MAFLPQFQPRLLAHVGHYQRADFWADLSAGLTVGVVALPLAMAFAIASGVKPEAGLITAVIAGFLISALGGSRVQIGGPAGAFVVIVYGIIERYGLANLLIATMMAGVLLMLMGFFRLGGMIRYIPVSIVIGFTNGIAVLIGLSQLREFFGLRIRDMPADFFAKLKVLALNLQTLHPPTLMLALASLALIVLWPRLSQRLARWPALAGLGLVPGSLLALILGTLAVTIFGVETETIGSRFGALAAGIPAPRLPELTWEHAKFLLIPTVTIALLGAIESLLCARIADAMIADRHDPNQELMAQGLANFVVPLFGGIPATGTIARTVTNIRSGAHTPVAGMIHALVLLAIMLVAAPWAEHIPLASLAAILLHVAWNMGEWREFARLKHFNLPYRTVLLAAFFLTVIVDLTVAVEVSLVLACGFFIYRVSALTRIEAIEPSLSSELRARLQGHHATATVSFDAHGADNNHERPLIQAYRIFGSLFFGTIGKIEFLLDPRSTLPLVLILDLGHLINLDTTGLDALMTLRSHQQRQGGCIIVTGLNEQPASLLQRGGWLANPENVDEPLVVVAESLPQAYEQAVDFVETSAKA